MGERALLRIGGGCGLAVVILEGVGFAWVAGARLFDVFHLYPSEALPLISQHARELQVLLSGEILGAVIVIPFWLALYQALKESKAAYALLGASAGILSSVVEVAMTLPRASMLPVLARAYPSADEFGRAALYALFYYAVSSTGSGLMTALRIPRIGFTSLALPRGRKFTRAVAWLGIATAALTIIEVGFWIIRGSPNDPLLVGVIAAALGRVWVILASVWLIRFE